MIWEQLMEGRVGAEALEDVFASLTVPTLPQAATQMLRLLREEECGPADLARVITNDPGMATQILRLVNSAHLGLPQEVSDVRLAVSLLGVNRIKSLVVGLSVADTLKTPDDGFDHEAFWTGALQRAAFAEVLAGRLCPGTEGEAFTGGLLQDMAQPVLAQHMPKKYLPALRISRGSGRELIEVEAEKLGFDHAEAGARLALAWNLPDMLVAAIGMHHRGAEELEERGLSRSPVAAVAASSRLPYAAPFVGELGLPLESYPEIAKTTDTVCRSLSGLFGVRKPKRLPLPADSGLAAPDREDP